MEMVIIPLSRRMINTTGQKIKSASGGPSGSRFLRKAPQKLLFMVFISLSIVFNGDVFNL